jgi:2-polyprenyl-6-methoxyphenol hydroxylase-like FAD-dependent oxidoreductase
VVLVGDAAHASTPNMGQGAAMALEDAAVLAELVGKGGPPDEILPAWEARRRPRALFVQTQSRRIGRVGQLSGRFACAARNALVRALPDRLAASALERLLAQEI